jgi:hypothetical protein
MALNETDPDFVLNLTTEGLDTFLMALNEIFLLPVFVMF